MNTEILTQINILQVGPFTFHLYGLIIGVSASIVLLGFIKLAPQSLTHDKHFHKMILLIFVSCILGGRLVYVLTNIDNFRNSYLNIFYIWKGGIGIFGVLSGGIIGYFIFWLLHFRKKPSEPKDVLSFFVLTDVVAVLIPLGQTTGRWANFVNQELFGPPTDLPWGIYIDSEHRPNEYINTEFFHPAFLYESILNFINFIILSQLFKNTRNSPQKKQDGVLTSLYLINYGIIRIVVERFRIDTDPIVLNIKLADIASFVIISIGLGILIFKLCKLRQSNIGKKK